MGLFDLLKRLAETSIVLSALLFTCGWSYLYGYLSGFGLGKGDMNFPAQTVIMFAAAVVRSPWILSIAGVLFFLGVLETFVPSLSRLSKNLSAPMVVALALILGVLLSNFGASLGRDGARRDIVLQTSTLPSVQFDLRSGLANEGCGLTSFSKILLHANGAYYVFKPLEQEKEPPSGQIKVCIVPDSEVRSARLQVGIGEY